MNPTDPINSPSARRPADWLDCVPVARWGLKELFLFGGPLLAITVALAFTWWYAAPIFGILFLFVVSFFRDPPRKIPPEPGLLVSPADGKVVEIARVENDEFIGVPAVRIAIFLTVFNVHVNRMPCRARVVKLVYKPGKFLHADHPEATRQNESMWIGLEEPEAPKRRMICRQVSGMIARRIVCELSPEQVWDRGEKFGMIKFGSRTELIVPAEGFEALVKVGQWIKGGRDVVGRYVGDGARLAPRG